MSLLMIIVEKEKWNIKNTQCFEKNCRIFNKNMNNIEVKKIFYNIPLKLTKDGTTKKNMNTITVKKYFTPSLTKRLNLEK